METSERENLQKNLVYFRKKHNLTQISLADKLGYSNKNISKWENGEIVPDIFMLNKLANIYGITIDQLLNGESDVINNELEQEILLSQKLKKRIIFLSFLIFCFITAIVCIIISTIIFSSPYKSEYSWLIYLYGGSVAFAALYVYYRLFSKKRVASIITLVVCLASFATSIYFSTHCSPWIFLLVAPLFFFIYFYSSLWHTIKAYRNRKKHKSIE